MKLLYFVLVLCAVIAVSGCANISKPYITEVARTDQDVSAGNKGYLEGTPPAEPDRGNLKRQFITVDVDLVEIKGKAPKSGEQQSVETKKEVNVVKQEAAPAPAQKPVIKQEDEDIK